MGVGPYLAASPVVVDLHGQLLVAVTESDLRGGGAGMPDDIGDRLLDDPESRQLHSGGE